MDKPPLSSPSGLSPFVTPRGRIWLKTIRVLPGGRPCSLASRHARRQAHNHVKSLERLGYQVNIQAITPDPGQPLSATT
jgi:hypothetical protein